MSKIKSYTDLPQSKKLAEILPLESADISYSFNFDSGIYEISTTSYKRWVVPKYAQPDKGFGQVIPCWSLAALISTLPKIVNNKTLFIETSAALWHVGYRDVYTARTDSLVDACYELILKLHELKML